MVNCCNSGRSSSNSPSQFFADRETVLGELNRGRHHVGKFQLAVGFQREFEASDGARHRDGFVADDGELFVERAVGLDVHVARGFAGCDFAIIKERGVSIGQTDEHEAAAADVSGGRFDDGQRKSHRNGAHPQRFRLA